MSQRPFGSEKPMMGGAIVVVRGTNHDDLKPRDSGNLFRSNPFPELRLVNIAPAQHDHHISVAIKIR